MRRLKIISRGTPLTTQVLDAITGEEIRGVTDISININTNKAVATVTMSVVDVDLDMEVELDG